MNKETRLFWKLDKVNFKNIRKILKDKSCIEQLINDYENIDYLYTLTINKIEIAFDILTHNNEFNKMDICDFIEKNESLSATESLNIWINMYGLPNIFVFVLNLEIYEKALKFLEETLEEYNLITVYNYKIKHLPETIIKESVVV